MDRVIVESLKSYKNLHAQMDDTEEQVNNMLRELSVPNLARFSAVQS